MISRIDATWRSGAAIAAAALLLALPATPASALTLMASDAGFVTEMGGSAKGDGTVVPGAKYNYSVGFEVHYADGFLSPPPYAPMLRKNYFVFDLSALSAPIVSAKLTLWTGTLETADPFEVYALHEPADLATALALAADLAAGTTTAEFDEIDDELVMKAKDLYGLLAEGPMLAAPFEVTSALDDGFIDLVLTPAAIAFLDGAAGGKVLLSGFVPSVDGTPPGSPPATPQQPFGFTGPDIDSGSDPLTPMLTVTVVPEPATLLMMLAGLAALPLLCRRRPS